MSNFAQCWIVRLFVVCTASALAAASATANAETLLPYVSYEFSETRKTETDDRTCTTQIFLSADGYLGFQHRETVHGATTPKVSATEFSNDYERKATPALRERLVRLLLDAKIFDATDEMVSRPSLDGAHLSARIDSRRAELFFKLPPQSPKPRAIHEAMITWAHEAKLDHPRNPSTATMISEGDREQAREVALTELIKHPARYRGKRIAVVGFYHGEFESEGLYVDQRASESHGKTRGIWKSDPSTFADRSALGEQNDAWVRIEGVFLPGPAGHMGLWPGEIVRLTSVTPAPAPE